MSSTEKDSIEAPLDAGMVPDGAEQHLALLLDLPREINGGATLERVFALVAAALRDIFSIDRFAVVLVQNDGALRLTTSAGLSPAYLDLVQQRIADGAGARSLRERRPLWIPDAPASPEFWPLQQAAQSEGFRTVLILPLFSGADPLGYLIMYHDAPRSYTLAEVALAQAVAQQAALAVQNARLLTLTEAHRLELERAFQQRVQEAQVTDEIVLSIASSLDLGHTLQSIADAAVQLSDSEYGSIWLRGEMDTFVAMASHGMPLEQLQLLTLTPTSGLLARMKQTLLPVAESEAGAVERLPDAREVTTRSGVRSTLGIPLLQEGDLVGAMYVATREVRKYSDETIRSLKRLSAYAEVALKNARRFSDVDAQRERLQAYVDAIPEGVMVFDRDCQIVLTNESLKRDWEFREPVLHILGTDSLRLRGPQGKALKFRFEPGTVLRRVISTGEPEQGLLELEDSPRMFEMHFGPLHGHGGSIDGIVATIRDITGPLELGRERSRSHLLAELLDVSASLNSDLSAGATMERVVESGMSIIGASSGTLGLIDQGLLVFRRFRLPTGWIDFDVALKPGEGSPGYVWQTNQPYLSNDTQHDAHILPAMQQRLGFQRIVTVPMLDRSGKFVGTLSVCDPVVERDFDQRDVEVLQMLANQAVIALENARLSELKDEFLSIVSHELKTPVTSIKGFTQVLQRRLSPESLERSGHYLEVINHQANRLTSLINDLLDLSRIQTGRFRFDLQALDYAGLIGEVVREMRLILAQNEITLVAPQTIRVMGNVERLRQVLVNLIDNAANHGPHGSRIAISVEGSGDEVITSIQDEGTGLSMDEAERIFRPYYQVRYDSRPQAKGLGLGLFISRQIIDEHYGRIWLDEGTGTRFCFMLPRA